MWIGVSGSRRYSDRAAITRALDERAVRLEGVVTGDASGADAIAREYAAAKGIPLVVHEADWDKHGKKAGPKRNALIVRDADLVLAFPLSDSKGTWDTVNKCRDRRVPVVVFDA